MVQFLATGMNEVKNWPIFSSDMPHKRGPLIAQSNFARPSNFLHMFQSIAAVLHLTFLYICACIFNKCMQYAWYSSISSIQQKN